MSKDIFSVLGGLGVFLLLVIGLVQVLHFITEWIKEIRSRRRVCLIDSSDKESMTLKERVRELEIITKGLVGEGDIIGCYFIEEPRFLRGFTWKDFSWRDYKQEHKGQLQICNEWIDKDRVVFSEGYIRDRKEKIEKAFLARKRKEKNNGSKS